MNNLNRVIILGISSFLFLSSCDNRKDYLSELNKEPELKIRESGTSNAFTQDLTDSFKLENGTYTSDYTISDEKTENVVMSSSYNSGAGTSSLSISDKKIVITPSGAGNHNIALVATDQFGKEKVSNINLIAFSNLLPLAVVTVTQTNASAPYEVNINASASYDTDAGFGGYIVEYEYIVVSTAYVVNTPFNNINFIFASPGTYNIYIRVKDNNGGWSPTTTVSINVI